MVKYSIIACYQKKCWSAVIPKKFPAFWNSVQQQQQQQISNNIKNLVSWQSLTITNPMTKRYPLYLDFKRTYNRWNWFKECHLYGSLVPRITAMEIDVSGWGCCQFRCNSCCTLVIVFLRALGTSWHRMEHILSPDTGSTRQSETYFMLPHTTNSKIKNSKTSPNFTTMNWFHAGFNNFWMCNWDLHCNIETILNKK